MGEGSQCMSAPADLECMQTDMTMHTAPTITVVQVDPLSGQELQQLVPSCC